MSGDDGDVLVRAKRGDRAAFATLIRKYQRRVYATAFHIKGNHGDADDVTQDALLRAYRGLAGFDGRADLFTWLYRITVNTALNHLRSKRRAQAALGQAGEGGEQAGDGPTPREWAEVGERMRRVLVAMTELSPTLRVTLALAAVEQLPYKQIAEILDIPEGTVAWRVNEARKQLRERLPDLYGDEGDEAAEDLATRGPVSR
jgi:RNA polymerase sigma-70 factor (ECF subfamily)